MKLLGIIGVAIVMLLQSSHAFSGEPKCAFTQTCVREQGQSPNDPCPDAKNANTPISQTSSPKLPNNGMKYLVSACPHMVNQEVCCNDDQILLMYNNFKTIDSLFGN